MSKLDLLFRNMELLNDDGEDVSQDIKYKIRNLMLEILESHDVLKNDDRYDTITRQNINFVLADIRQEVEQL